MKKTILITVGLSLGIIGLMLWGRSSSQTAVVSENIGAISSLTASEKLYDFGTISMADGKVEKVFKVTNLSAKDAILSSVETSCMCTTAYIVNGGKEKGPFGMPGHGGPGAKANEVIKAGESRDIKVVYDPNAHGPAGVGQVDRFIDLTETNGGLTRLEIKAVVTP